MEFKKINSPKELLEFMSNNIKYGYVSKNGKIYDNQDSSSYWDDWYINCLVQTGEEVLKTKVGTCWDQVELERLWFENNNYEFKTFFIRFEVNKENDYPTHTFLLYKKDNKWYWFENSFEASRGIHEFCSIHDAINYVKEKQLEYAINIGVAKKSDYKYIKSYEYTKLEKPLSVDEYLNHVVLNDINKKSNL